MAQNLEHATVGSYQAAPQRHPKLGSDPPRSQTWVMLTRRFSSTKAVGSALPLPALMWPEHLQINPPTDGF